MSRDKNRADFRFEHLVDAIETVHVELAVYAKKAVNQALTLRNWLIGFYISEYELSGSDRAEYGARLIDTLEESLAPLPRTGRRDLYKYRAFYKAYPQIVESLTPQSGWIEKVERFRLNEKVRSATTQLVSAGSKLLERLSYTHFEQLFTIEDDTKRAFYEQECIRGNWSVRELKRQPARRDIAVHEEEPLPRGIRPCRNGGRSVRVQVPTRAAEQGGDGAVPSAEDRGGAGMMGYVYKPPRPLEGIDVDLDRVSAATMELLREVHS